MKILWLSHLIPYPPKGGVLQRSFNLIKELSKSHEIDLLAFNQKNLIGPLFKSVNEGVSEASSVLGDMCLNYEFFDITCENRRLGRYSLAFKSILGRPYNINWLESSVFKKYLSFWLQQYSYDVVHFDTISLVPYFKLAPKNVITCLDHHNIESHMLLRRSKNEMNPLKKLYFYQEGIRLAKYEKQFCPLFDLNITCSDLDSKRLTSIAPKSNVLTIPNGVDINFFKPKGIKEKENKIIFVGTMNWYPNIEAVLFLAETLWPDLKTMFPNLECDIVGANPPQKILNLSKQYKDFHVHGFVDDVRPYMETATVYVCPINDGGGTKLKILDAMAMSKAIVAHPMACEGINVTDNLNIQLANDKNSFLSKIAHFLRSPEDRIKFGEEARLLIENQYGYQAIGKQFSNSLQRLANKSCVA